MKAIALFLRTTILGGIFFLAPIVVLIAYTLQRPRTLQRRR